MESDGLAELTLTQLGFDVIKLPVAIENDKKMPDFLVRRGASSALVEAKLKGDDPNETLRRAETLEAGEVYYSKHVLGRNETLSGIVHKGQKQLKADTGYKSDFKVLFVLANGINANVVSEQLVDTLYGRTTVFEFSKAVQTKPRAIALGSHSGLMPSMAMRRSSSQAACLRF